VLENTTAFSSAGKFGKEYALLKENLDGQTFRAFNHSLTTQWDVLPQDQSMIKEYYRVKESQEGQFAGVIMNYHVWRRRFIAIVNSQRRLRSEIQLLSLESVKTLTTVEDQDVTRTGNEGAVHQVEFKDNCVFRVHKDRTLAVTRHMLTSGRESGRKVRKSVCVCV
jgi:hypothetical protein